MLLQRLHRQNFDADINLVAHIKRQVFDKQIVGDKSVFAKLNFYRDAVFYKIGLVEAMDGRGASQLDFTFLLSGGL